MDARVRDLINQQINKELYSAYLYMDIADYYEEEGLKGYANYYMIQAAEERFMGPLEIALEHEQYVTALINDIYAAALEAKDFRCQTFLQWFITEQLEEEDNAEDMITKMKLFGSDPKGLYALDAEYAARVYTVPSPLAGK